MNAYLKPNKFYWANTNWKESNKKSLKSTYIELDKVSESIMEFVDHKDISTRYVREYCLHADNYKRGDKKRTLCYIRPT